VRDRGIFREPFSFFHGPFSSGFHAHNLSTGSCGPPFNHLPLSRSFEGLGVFRCFFYFFVRFLAILQSLALFAPTKTQAARLLCPKFFSFPCSYSRSLISLLSDSASFACYVFFCQAPLVGLFVSLVWLLFSPVPCSPLARLRNLAQFCPLRRFPPSSWVVLFDLAFLLHSLSSASEGLCSMEAHRSLMSRESLRQQCPPMALLWLFVPMPGCSLFTTNTGSRSAAVVCNTFSLGSVVRGSQPSQSLWVVMRTSSAVLQAFRA